MTSRIALAIGALSAALVQAGAARAAPAVTADEPRPPPPAIPMALGFNLDLLPTVLSAANGRFGAAPQVWLGLGHARVRFVGSHLEPPDAFAFAPSGFHHPTTTAFAAILDYTFGSRFDGAWIGSGFEVWEQTITHDGVSGTASWTSTVFTLGAGYIWRFAGDFFVDPWVGGHVVLNPQTVSLGAFSFQPFPLVGEASVKVGWFVNL